MEGSSRLRKRLQLRRYTRLYGIPSIGELNIKNIFDPDRRILLYHRNDHGHYRDVTAFCEDFDHPADSGYDHKGNQRADHQLCADPAAGSICCF